MPPPGPRAGPARRAVCTQGGLALALAAGARGGRGAEAAGPPPGGEAAEVTHRVFLEIGLCPTAYDNNRTLGSLSALCEEPAVLGRLGLGLYGNLVPSTVQNFLALVESKALDNTTFSKVKPGEYILAAKQGSHRYGEVEAPPGLVENRDVVSARAFGLRHDRGGVVSLMLSDGSDEGAVTQRRGYTPLEFLITTGPGPVPALDGENIVFGVVEEGYDVLRDIVAVPIFAPNSNITAFNMLASTFGDERAARARKSWGKPLKAVVITGSGIIAPPAAAGEAAAGEAAAGAAATA